MVCILERNDSGLGVAVVLPGGIEDCPALWFQHSELAVFIDSLIHVYIGPVLFRKGDKSFNCACHTPPPGGVRVTISRTSQNPLKCNCALEPLIATNRTNYIKALHEGSSVKTPSRFSIFAIALARFRRTAPHLHIVACGAGRPHLKPSLANSRI